MQIVERVRKGPIKKAAQRLIDDARRQMLEPGLDEPSKPDDLTFLLYRLR